MLAKGAEISRTNLLAGQSSCNRWQLEDDPKHRRQSPVTPEDLIVENQILQFPAFNRHQHSFMRRVDRSDDKNCSWFDGLVWNECFSRC